MKVTLLPTTWLKRYVQDQSQLTIEVPETSTVSQCLEIAGIPNDEVGIIIRNDVRIFENELLKDGDHIKLFATIIGG